MGLLPDWRPVHSTLERGHSVLYEAAWRAGYMIPKVVFLGGEIPRRRTEPTARDQRRLACGAEALALPEPETIGEIRAQLKILHMGICALQSMDDLGSNQANAAAWADMLTLQEKHARLKAKIQ
jgi:hypothetical protein